MGLLGFLKENKDARKIFGKKELRIVEKQLKGVSLTQSEKNRLSRDVRPKFEFIKECARFSDEFKIKKGQEIKKIIEETKQEILKDVLLKKIKRVFLYGSFTENKFTFKSDIDIAVEFTDISLEEATLFRKRVQGKVNKQADIQVFNVLPKPLKDEIIEKGKVLYEPSRIKN